MCRIDNEQKGKKIVSAKQKARYSYRKTGFLVVKSTEF
jgi:hypothetical protein